MRLRSEHGQAIVVTVAFLAVLIGLAAAVLDVGAWFRLHRQLQATADASALAGAQALPDSPAGGAALALEYGTKNGGGVSSAGITITGEDTIAVSATKPAPGIFASLFGLDSLDVAARAKARSAVPGEARWAAPIAVDKKHPFLSGIGCPCMEQKTELDLEKVGPGAFRLLNLDDSKGGTGPPILAEWITKGYDGYMPLKWYSSDPGAKFNSSQVKNALDQRIGDELLFPVYQGTRGNGANFEYDVIGWVGFHLTGYTIKGSKNNKLYGWFTQVIWEGIVSESASSEDFGVRAIELIE
jgi:putative Flp pilus-assembly TadE/G-like protein